MKRILLSETELTRLIQRVVNEQVEIPTDLEGNVPPEAYDRKTQDDIMDMIHLWCRDTAPGSEVKGANCLDNEPKDILFAIRDYCEGPPKTPARLGVEPDYQGRG